MEDRSSFHAPDSNNSLDVRVQWYLIPGLLSSVVHCPPCKNTIWLNPTFLGKKEKKTPAHVLYSKHYFLLISRMFKALFTFIFNHNKVFASVFHLSFLWFMHKILIHLPLHSCGIFPKYTSFKGFALSYLFSAEPQGKDNAISLQPGSTQGTKQRGQTSLFTF